MPLLKTPLHSATLASGASMGEWEGWELPLSYGGAAAEYATALDSVTVYDASSMGCLKATGTDVLDLLHRLSTNAVESLTTGQGASTILTDDRGRIIDLITVTNLGDYILLLTSPNMQQRIVQWLDKYTILEDIEVEDLTGSTPVIGLVGPSAANVAQALTGIDADALQPYHSEAISTSGLAGHVLRCDMGGLTNIYVIGEEPSAGALWRGAVEAGAKPLGLEAYQALRIELGMPANGSELGDAYNPLEAGLMGAISFTKGCYIGQEVIARLDTYQKVQRRLVSLTLTGPVDPGARLVRDDREVGVITSVSRLPTSGHLRALGYVRMAAAEAGATFDLQNAAGVASIEALLEPLGPGS